MAYQTVNPSTGELLRTFDEQTDQQMEEMLATAERTFREVWSRKSVRERAKVIGEAAFLMLDQKEKFARFATLEMGKRIAEARGEVELSAMPKGTYKASLNARSRVRFSIPITIVSLGDRGI
jgi:succinate-semialdehyde dehydrogenase / glutarate-semialdehyde dehydrogenase